MAFPASLAALASSTAPSVSSLSSSSSTAAPPAAITQRLSIVPVDEISAKIDTLNNRIRTKYAAKEGVSSICFCKGAHSSVDGAREGKILMIGLVEGIASKILRTLSQAALSG